MNGRLYLKLELEPFWERCFCLYGDDVNACFTTQSGKEGAEVPRKAIVISCARTIALKNSCCFLLLATGKTK
jgi:hypothetical protein